MAVGHVGCLAVGNHAYPVDNLPITSTGNADIIINGPPIGEIKLYCYQRLTLSISITISIAYIMY